MITVTPPIQVEHFEYIYNIIGLGWLAHYFLLYDFQQIIIIKIIVNSNGYTY